MVINFISISKMYKVVLLASLAAVAFGGTIPENAGIEEYIVGGRDTDISEVPYQVAMHYSGKLMCGGSIVAPTMIVTAGHCLRGQSPSFITFRAGSPKPNEGGVVVKVKKAWCHPSYDPGTIDYDVAVMEIDPPLNFSSTIQAIPLATSEPRDGTPVKVSGWGLLKEKGPLATTLQSVELPMVNRKTCSAYLSQYLSITPRMICAGVEGKDSCQGDSGGPLTDNGKLVGIVSFGVGCARKDFPGVYTNVVDPRIAAFIRKYARI